MAVLAAKRMLAILSLALLTGSRPLEAAGVEGVAYLGEPFGVGRVTVQIGHGQSLPSDALFRLTSSDGRALYPAFQVAGVPVPTRRARVGPFVVSCYFLFTGNKPLKLQLESNGSVTIEPKENTAAHENLLGAWWGRYRAAAHAMARSDAYPPIVEQYLVSTLARRLDLEAGKFPHAWSPLDQVDQTFSVLTGAESVRIAAQSKVLLKSGDQVEIADRPLPVPATAPPIRLPEFDDEVALEPIADHVPVECFYVRCGSYANFKWLRETMDDWGAKIRHITSIRGVDYRVAERLERQLALRETVLGRLLGDSVISDVAVIGTDTFVREGAAIGILFEARSSTVLGHQISAMRTDARAAEDGAMLQTIEIAGRDVSLLATPDNRVRSYYAVDGKYHLVTTSETLAQRFFEAGEGKQPLGSAKEFRWARHKMPLEAGHDLFVYLSDPFFRMLISPAYRIEMTRRARAISEIDVVRIAQLAAKAEGRKAKSVDELISAGLLPEGFGQRVDDSHVVVRDDEAIDSRRGGYGTFVPVPDMEIPAATRSEVESYQDFSRRYASEWRRMDPVMVGVRHRQIEDKGYERISLDVHITPYSRSHYGSLATFLSPADKLAWSGAPGDLATIRANIMGVRFAAGLSDFTPQFAIHDGRVQHTPARDNELPLYAVGQQGADRLYNMFGLFGNRDQKASADADGLHQRKATLLAHV